MYSMNTHTNNRQKITTLVAILCSALLISTAGHAAPPSRTQIRPHTATVQRAYNPLAKMPRSHRQYAAARLVKKHFTNKYGSDGALLSAVNAKVSQNKPHGFNEAKFAQITSNLSVKQQQVISLNTLARISKSDTLTSAAVNKLSEIGDASSHSALRWAMIKGGTKTIPATVNAIKAISNRDSKFAPQRKVLDLSKTKNVRTQVERVLNRGAIESIKPLSTDNHHAFDTYLVTFKNQVNGQQVKAVFKPTGPQHAENWLRFSGNLHGRSGAYSFMSREVFAYQFDKMLGMGLVPPTTAATVDVPGAGKVMGSMQYFMPGSKAIGNNWKDTRPEFSGFAASQDGVRQQDTMKTMSWIMSSVEHVPTSLMGGNKGNILVAHKTKSGFPVGISTPNTGKRMMLIDNASSFTHKQYLSDNVLPLRFEQKLVKSLKGLQKNRFMKLATPYLGDHEANWAWGRIQHTLNVAKTRPEWK